MMQSLKEIGDIILAKTDKEDRIVHGIWGIDCFFCPPNNGRVFNYKFIVSKTVGQGASYSTIFDYSREDLCKYVGKDFMEHSIDDQAIKIALYDSLYWTISEPKKYVKNVSRGSSSEKLKWRTSIVLDEAKKLLGRLDGKRIVNVGVVGDFIKAFDEKGAVVIGTDFDEAIVGRSLFGSTRIVDGKNTLSEVSRADLAVVTGMTIATETIDDIINCCKKNNVKLIVFAETGANLAGYYVNMGVDVYLAEHFPFYIFDGTSVIDVCYPD